MSNQQKQIKGKLEVSLGNAIKFVADVEDEKEIVSILSSLEKIKEQLGKFDKVFSGEHPVMATPPFEPGTAISPDGESYEKIADMLQNVTPEKLRAEKIFRIKDQNVQLLKPNRFNVTDAICVLLFILEVGAGRRDIQYDTFRDIFESQNIKSGSPLTMLMTNLKNSKYIDPGKYKLKKISLTPKGQEQAVTVLNKFLKE